MDDLAAAGVDRREVDLVLCTHLHYDHVGWNTLLEGERRVPTFPNARYLFGREEWAHWKRGEESDLPNTIGECVQPIIDAGLATFVETDHRLTDEVRLEASPGHTPGHVSVRIESGGQEAFITGDAIVHPVQWAEVEWGNAAVDHDLTQAVEVRRALRQRYAESDALIIGTHFATPTAGHLRKGREGWWFEALSR